MRDARQQFPVHVRTGWTDYSPALHDHATQRVASRLAGFAPQIRSVIIRIADDASHHARQRRCDIEVVTTHAGPIAASSVGVNPFRLVDGAVDTVFELLRQHSRTQPQGELRQRIA
jgi:hypothetical protein